MIKTKHLIYTYNGKQKRFLIIRKLQVSLELKNVAPRHIIKQLNLYKPY